jgi:membrane dipeptidase
LLPAKRSTARLLLEALGSDFDGATVPNELGDVAGYPKLLDALADAGFSAGDIRKIAWDNWRRVLGAWWR